MEIEAKNLKYNNEESSSIAFLKYFKYDHLPKHLQSVSKSFHDLAEHMVLTLPCNSERQAGLRKLLESKDCAVRALL